ncbi:DUF3168 domain-containing protein [Rhodobacter capsulatus]|uniref:DUF3168 domain-containing protein n=1 Tax=Rhodobacter capsulatus TaxID=1061 RepID=UPI00402768F8
MEESFRAALLASGAVTALAGERIDFGANPQDTACPRLVLWTIAETGGLLLSGPDGVSRGRVQVDCYAESYGAAKRLSRAVRAALDGYSGGGFQGVFHAGTRDSHDSEAPFRVSLDFITVFTS